MANYTVGALIRDARERQKYSQEELSYGICTPSTLSRIENGIQRPGKKILQGLFQRLGIIDQVHDICLSKAEMEQYEMEQHLIRCLGKKEYGKAEQLVCTLEEIIQKKPPFKELLVSIAELPKANQELLDQDSARNRIYRIAEDYLKKGE